MKNILIVGSGQAGLITATTIKACFPEFDVTVVASSEIPPIGVGEGSTEQWTAYEKRVGIDRPQLLKESMATLKHGIRFLHWTNHTPDYFHSISSGQRYAEPGTFNGVYSFIHASGRKLTPSLAHQGLVKNFVQDVENEWNQVNQFHFDSHKLNIFLKNHAKSMGIDFINAEVQGIFRDSENGDITHVITSSGKIETDFVVDASGFKQVILNELGDIHQTSFSDYLPCDTALVFQTPGNHSIKAFTEAKALSAGWHWDIPTYERRGHGYVFSSEHITEERAAQEVEYYIDEPVKDARIIKYKPYKVQNSWQFNCVAVGLASNFIEPLEATSIAATIEQARLLCSYLPTYKPNSNGPQYGYLKVFDSIFDNLLTMVSMHYVSDRKDTPMWQDQQDAQKTELLRFLLEIFKHRGPENHDLSLTGFELFGPAHFWHVGQGQGLISREGCEVGVDVYSSTPEALEVIREVQVRNSETPEIPHRTLLDRLHKEEDFEIDLDWAVNDFKEQSFTRLEQ